MTRKNKQKGYRTVSKGKKLLVSQGYIYTNLEKSGRFVKEKDLFGLWDALFIRGKVHLFVQFKTNASFGVRKPRKWLIPYIEFGRVHGSSLVRYEVWNWIDNKGFEIYKCQ